MHDRHERRRSAAPMVGQDGPQCFISRPVIRESNHGPDHAGVDDCFSLATIARVVDLLRVATWHLTGLLQGKPLVDGEIQKANHERRDIFDLQLRLIKGYRCHTQQPGPSAILYAAWCAIGPEVVRRIVSELIGEAPRQPFNVSWGLCCNFGQRRLVT